MSDPRVQRPSRRDEASSAVCLPGPCQPSNALRLIAEQVVHPGLMDVRRRRHCSFDLMSDYPRLGCRPDAARPGPDHGRLGIPRSFDVHPSGGRDHTDGPGRRPALRRHAVHFFIFFFIHRLFCSLRRCARRLPLPARLIDPGTIQAVVDDDAMLMARPHLGSWITTLLR